MNDSDDLVVDMSWNALNAVTKVTKSNEFVLITKRIPRASLLGKKGGNGNEVAESGVYLIPGGKCACLGGLFALYLESHSSPLLLTYPVPIYSPG